MNDNGSPLYLKDVADIKDTWSKSSIERYQNIKDQLMSQ